ncbi:hypothetical protein KA005_10385, partial [bacterium]|nr:hypothetical protein [bacterium]
KDAAKMFAMEKKQGKKPVLDPSTRKAMKDFISQNKNVSLKEFEKARLAAYVGDILIEDIMDTHGMAYEDIPSKIKDKKDRDIYAAVREVRRRYRHKEYIFCKGDDERKIRKSQEKIWKLKKKLPKDRGNYVERMKVYEQMLDECRVSVHAIPSLLAIYRYEEFDAKYNNLMLRLIREDQVDYDYSRDKRGELGGGFASEYRIFLVHNSPDNVNLLTKSQVKMVAEALLTKHQGVLVLREYEDDTHMFTHVLGLTYLSQWLKQYKLDDLREKIARRFFDNEITVWYLRVHTVSDPERFKEELEYLRQLKIVEANDDGGN